MEEKNLDVATRSRWLLPSLPLLVIALLFFSINILSEVAKKRALLVDLTVYQKASDFIAQGLNPYSPAFDWLDLRWQYPPFALIPIVPLHYVPWEVVVPLWILTTAVLPLLLMIAIVAHRVFPNMNETRNGRLKRFGLITLLALVTATASPFINSTYLGQIGLVLAAIVFFDLAAPDSWKTLGRFKLPKGIGVGIATAIKLTPGIFIVHLLLTKQWKPALTAIATVISSWTLAFIIFPAYSIYTFFEGGLFRAATDNNVLRLLALDNISAAAAFDRVRYFVFGQDPETMAAWPKYAVILILAIGLLWVSSQLHRNGQWMYALIVVGIGSALVSPVAWLNHAIWLTLLAPLMFLLGLAARHNRAYKTADRYFIAGVAFIALASYPSQFLIKVQILPTPWDGLFIPMLMVGSIVALFALGRTRKAVF